MHALRSAALAAIIALTTVACAAAEDLAERAVEAGTELASELETLAPDGAAPGGQDGATPPEEGAPPPGEGPDGGEGEPGTDQPGRDGSGTEATPVADRGPVGANGRAMLRGDRARLVIEVDVQEGLRADPAALDHLVAELGRYAEKPGGIQLTGGNTFSSDRTAWSPAELRAVADANRSTSSDGGTVSLYLLYVRGGFHSGGEETNAIGVAHSASELALFPERWSGLGDVLGSARAIERAVLVHELGHALGLVNLTYTSPTDREDPDHPGHSANRGSVMHWAIETTVIGQVFSGPPPDRFDEADATDLRGLRDGTL